MVEAWRDEAGAAPGSEEETRWVKERINSLYLAFPSWALFVKQADPAVRLCI